jgi:NAD(P)-dependent dehydrogenase (short-subunit alcohol dehydrogenase family)
VPLDTHFEGKVAIVTGAASGIGRALSAALVARGASVVLADIDETRAAEAAASLHAGPPGRASAAALDVRDPRAVADLIDRTVMDHGHLDLMFNNAGIGVGGEVANMTLAHFDRAMDVNLRGVLNGVMAAYPVMSRQGRGHIVNTASVAGLLPSPGLAPYAMTKHAVVGLSLSLRPEAQSRGVRVSVVCPGVIDTPILDKGNPPDLPSVGDLSDGRQALERALGKAYPPELLARDVLAGVARNRPIIVAPHHARRAWIVYRMAPSLTMAFVSRGFSRFGTRGTGLASKLEGPSDRGPERSGDQRDACERGPTEAPERETRGSAAAGSTKATGQ